MKENILCDTVEVVQARHITMDVMEKLVDLKPCQRGGQT